MTQLDALCKRVVSVSSSHFLIDHKEISFSISIGVTCERPTDKDVDAVLGSVDKN